MAKNFPRGFVPVNNRAGTAPQINYYDVDPALANKIYIGAPLELTLADGYVRPYAGGDENFIGVSAGVVQATPGGTPQVAVFDDPEQEFVCQGDDTAVDWAAGISSFLGYFVGITASTTGNDNSNQSTCELDSSTVAAAFVAGAGTIWKIIRVDSTPGNDVGDADLDVIVKPAPQAHVHASGAAA